MEDCSGQHTSRINTTIAVKDEIDGRVLSEKHCAITAKLINFS